MSPRYQRISKTADGRLLSDIAVLRAIAWYAARGETSPTQAAIARRTGYSHNAIRNAARRLEASGQLRITRRGLGCSHIYQLTGAGS